MCVYVCGCEKRIEISCFVVGSVDLFGAASSWIFDGQFH